MLASLCYLGWALDFWLILITGKNLINTNGWVGIITAMWLPPAICIEIYGFSKYLMSKNRWYIIFIFIVLALIFEFFLFFDTKSSLVVEYPTNPGEDLIEIHTIYGSPLFFLAVIFIISTLFLGFGFLNKSRQSIGLKRKRYFYLFISELLFFFSGVLDALFSPGIFLIFSRLALIITPLLVYYVFKEIKKNHSNVIVEIQDELFRFVEYFQKDDKSEFLSRASHEFKTPFTAIKGNIEFLYDKFHSNFAKIDNEINNKFIDIKQGCERFLLLIDDLLLSFELESNELQLDMTSSNLSNLIRSCVKEFQGLIEKRKLSIFIKIHDNLTTRFDRERIRIVIKNVLMNAVKYTLPTGILKIYSEVNNDFITVIIEDSGIGIEKEEKSKLFRLFGKIEQYGKGQEIIPDGLGLGLHQSKKIVELHGGRIELESKGRNRGVKFSFTLPVKNGY